MRRPSGGACLACSGLIVALLAGCAARPGGASAPAEEPSPDVARVLPTGAPRPDNPPRRGLGVAVDPELELPAPMSSAISESGLVVLQAPVDVRPALRVVSDFFEAASAESPEMLERLLERTAHTRASTKARAEAALPAFRRRFDRLDYTTLATELVYRAADVKVHTANEGAVRLLPMAPKGDEILVQVFPVGQTAAKLFAGELDFLLKPSSSGYKIAEMVEDFRLP
jgi:hypothetical protein